MSLDIFWNYITAVHTEISLKAASLNLSIRVTFHQSICTFMSEDFVCEIAEKMLHLWLQTRFLSVIGKTVYSSLKIALHSQCAWTHLILRHTPMGAQMAAVTFATDTVGVGCENENCFDQKLKRHVQHSWLLWDGRKIWPPVQFKHFVMHHI